jgi:hypothetical protein
MDEGERRLITSRGGAPDFCPSVTTIAPIAHAREGWQWSQKRPPFLASKTWVDVVQPWWICSDFRSECSVLARYNYGKYLTYRSLAGEGNRTLVSSLGSWRSTIELHPQNKEVKVTGER